MKPKKSKELIPIVSKELDIHEDIVSSVVNFYWEEIRRNLSSLKQPKIHLTNLGDFVIKHWKLTERITTLEQFEEKNKQKGLQQMTARFKTAEKVFDMKNLQIMISQENQRAEFIKTHKKLSNESKGKRHTDMEE